MLPLTAIPKEKLEVVKGKGGVVAKGFFQFVRDYGVAPLAIGVVIANATNDLVKTLVDGLFSPLIALLTPGGKLQTFQMEFHGAIFKVGLVINSLLSFLIIFLLIYLLAKLVLRNEELLRKK